MAGIARLANRGVNGSEKTALTYLHKRQGDEQDRQDGPRVQGRGAEVGRQWQLGRLCLAGLP